LQETFKSLEDKIAFLQAKLSEHERGAAATATATDPDTGPGTGTGTDTAGAAAQPVPHHISYLHTGARTSNGLGSDGDGGRDAGAGAGTGAGAGAGSGGNLRGTQGAGAAPTATAMTAAGAGTDVKTQKGARMLGYDTVLLIIASPKRPQYLQRCLAHVVQHHPLHGVAIVVSEDGNSPEVETVVRDAQRKLQNRFTAANDANANANAIANADDLLGSPFTHVHHIATMQERGENGYFALSAHFKFALTHVFTTENRYSPITASGIGGSKHGAVISLTNRVIILEEDLEISPDFFEYFGALSPLLDRDEHLLTVSAWNDNGQTLNVRDSQALLRSDFFPGLGWMMNKRLYSELIAKWPRAYWDDWLREPKQRKGRHSIRPEVSRTLHYGKHGVSANQFQGEYMDKMLLNAHYVPFGSMDLSYLHELEWDTAYLQAVKEAELVSPQQFDSLVPKSSRHLHPMNANANANEAPMAAVTEKRRKYVGHSHKEYRVMYTGNSGFERTAHWAGMYYCLYMRWCIYVSL